jgi:two-component system sensor histidine kinase RegB
MRSASKSALSIPQSLGATERRPDTPGTDDAQGQGGATGRTRTRTRTLILLRAAYIIGQFVILLVTWRLLKWRIPVTLCLGVIGTSLALNLSVAVSSAARRVARPWGVGGQLVFDILQLATLLYLTGGVVNPFALLLIGPVTVAGRALPPGNALKLSALTLLVILGLSFMAAGPSLSSGGVAQAGDRLTHACGLIIGALFAGGYAIWSSAEEARMELALHVTETVLAREQRLSALGALAAALAHELGTPLATMSVIATEMVRETPSGPLRDDAVLLVEQARRCRDILARLAEAPERADAPLEGVSLAQFAREIIEPYAGTSEVRVGSLVTGPSELQAPNVSRRPEILHAISTIVENAVDFARSEAMLTARFDAGSVSLEVRDDGPGFDAAILPRLGEPYVTGRTVGEGSRGGHAGMGLGLFIAKTLLERSGARVTFGNEPGGGALVTARWPRSRLEFARPPG